MPSSGFYVYIMYTKQQEVAPYCFPAVILRAQIDMKRLFRSSYKLQLPS